MEPPHDVACGQKLSCRRCWIVNDNGLKPCLVQGWLDGGVDGVRRIGSPSVLFFADDDSVIANAEGLETPEA